jgi:hypothetical protein
MVWRYKENYDIDNYKKTITKNENENKNWNCDVSLDCDR